MSESSFRFRHFTIHQDKCAMKVGTDAVLLGSWVRPGSASRILDVGTGTGILAIMLAQKSSAVIDAIDIDAGAYQQTRENVMISPWFNRIHPKNESFQSFAQHAQQTYDLIVTNPPYFHEASKPSEEGRLHARHNDQLSFEELAEGVKKILAPDGRFCIILPFKEGMEFIDLALRKGLFCHHLLRVKSRSDRQEKRILMEFDRLFGLLHDEMIVMRDNDMNFTEEYLDLTRDYYISLK